jgi:hypothetical protein
VRDCWTSLRQGQQRPRAIWDSSSGRVIAFLFPDSETARFAGNEAEPTAAVALTPLQEPHDNDLRFVQILCRVFNEDVRAASDTLTQSELWEVLSATRFARSIGRFSAFSTLPFMHWLRTIESASHLRYEGRGFSANILMTKQRQWIEQRVKTFVPFSAQLDFEHALLREKWIRVLLGDPDVGLVGLGHSGLIIGVTAIPRRKAKDIIAPHRSLTGAVALVRPGTMAFICAPNGDLYVVLPNGAAFLKTQGKWHYLNYSSFRNLLRKHISAKIAHAVLRTVLDLTFQRTGALLCFLDDSESVVRLVPDYGRRKRANQALRMAVTDLDITKVAHQQLLLSVAGVDGATVFSKGGQVLDSACMIGEPDATALARVGLTELERFPGARSTAAWNASLFGLSIKVSEDGPITVYKAGRLIGQMA